MADILTTERFTFKFRLLAVLAIGMAYWLAGADGDGVKVALALLAYLIYAFGLQAMLARWQRRSLVFLMIVVDAAFLGLLPLWSGSAATLIIIAYPVMVPFYAVYAAYSSAFFAATVMLVVLALTQLAMGRLMFSMTFLTQIPLYYLLAALTGYLAEGRLRRLAEQESLQRLLRLENEARSLSGAVRTIQESSDLGAMLQEMAETAPRLVGLPECLIAILDRKSGALVARASTTDVARLGVDRLDYLVEWPQEGSLSHQVLGLQQPVAIRQPSEDDATLPLWAERVEARAILAVPLASRDVEIGVMYFYGLPEGYVFTAREVDLAQAFADMVALVAVNAQLYEDVQVTIASVMSDLRPVMLPKPGERPRRLSVIEVGDLVVDLANRQAKIAGKPVNLTPTEFDLLGVLAENSGRAVDQEVLLRRVWGEDYTGRSTVVDVGVHRLRRKIEGGQGAPRRIITVRGSGYMLVPANAVTLVGG